MIKKVVFLFFLLIPSFFFAEEKNIISRQTYKAIDIESISVNVLFENIYVSTIYGDEILIEIGSNNNQFLPIISQQDSCLKIKTNERNSWSPNSGTYCSIYIYVPFDYVPDNYDFIVSYGKISLQNITATNFIKLNGGEKEAVLSNLKTDYFCYIAYNEAGKEVVISNLDCTYFEIRGFVGDISLSLAKAPEASSIIRTKEGAISLDIPASEDFEVKISSTHSTAINNYIGELYPNIRNGLLYKHNQGGAEIIVQTFKGQITLGK